MKKTIIILCSGLLLLVACKKEQPEMTKLNVGCDCAEEVTSKFQMLEMTTGNENFARYTETDSIFGDKNVLFKALTDNAEYTWYIGSEVLKTREVTRFFPNSMVGQTVPITLVTKKKANTICFPNDDGYDSVVKYLTIAQLDLYNNYDTTLVEGTFRMKSPLLPDSVDIKIDYVEDFINSYFNFYNYDGKGSKCEFAINTSYVDLNYRQLWTDNSFVVPCDYVMGDIVLVRSINDVEMNFTTGDFVNGNYVNVVHYWKYKGRKL